MTNQPKDAIEAIQIKIDLITSLMGVEPTRESVAPTSGSPDYYHYWHMREGLRVAMKIAIDYDMNEKYKDELK